MLRQFVVGAAVSACNIIQIKNREMSSMWRKLSVISAKGDHRREAIMAPCAMMNSGVNRQPAA
jgi:hypothetical protein